MFICPDWSEDWWYNIQGSVLKKYYYRPGVKFFELPHQEVQGLRWGVWAYLVDGAVQKEEMMVADKEFTVLELEGKLCIPNLQEEGKGGRSSKKVRKRKYSEQPSPVTDARFFLLVALCRR